MCTDQERLAAAHVHIRFAELRTAGAHRLDLPALQLQPRLVAVFDEIVEARPAVFGNQAVGGFGFGHGEVCEVVRGLKATLYLRENGTYVRIATCDRSRARRSSHSRRVACSPSSTTSSVIRNSFPDARTRASNPARQRRSLR